MKPWLLNILACPMCKHHPLTAYIFSWETSSEEAARIVEEAGRPKEEYRRAYRHTVRQLMDGTLSMEAMKAINDLSGNEHTARMLERVLKCLERLFSAKSEMSSDRILKEMLPDVDVAYRYMNLLEVDCGILFCPNCMRWYPIGSSVPTVPEMLPDDLRDKKKDLEFLSRWREKVPEVVLTEGKPHTLGATPPRASS